MTQPERGGFWQSVTGGVETGESVETAAKREAQEETGLSFHGEPIPLDFQFQFESRGQFLLEYCFYFDVSNFKNPIRNKFPEIRLDPHEHLAFQWVDSDTALSLLGHPSSKDVLNRVLKKLQSVSNS